MKGIECLICHEPPTIPVHMTAFECKPDPCTGQKCGSLSVVCLLCAVRFMKLDVPPEKRAITAPRCPLCRSGKKFFMYPEDAYQVDFLYMSMDTQILSCPLCPSFTGTQTDVYRHLRRDCPGWKIMCTEDGCRQFYPRGEQETHQNTTCKGFTTCKMCSSRVRHDHYLRHVVVHHPDSFLTCVSCTERVRARESVDHSRTEIDHLESLYNGYRTQIERLDALKEYIPDWKRQTRWLRDNLNIINCRIQVLNQRIQNLVEHQQQEELINDDEMMMVG